VGPCSLLIALFFKYCFPRHRVSVLLGSGGEELEPFATHIVIIFIKVSQAGLEVRLQYGDFIKKTIILLQNPDRGQ
jgi:hypothetical protein